MKLSQLASITNGQLFGIDSDIIHLAEQICIDTRKLTANAIYIAIQGDNFDGHDFVSQAHQKGALISITEKAVESPHILVSDTREALGKIAHHWRKQFSLPIVALTGSCGKTTTKEMIASILRTQGAILATEGTLNNDIGVPLTLLRLRAEHRFAVIEEGANHAGEIDYMNQLVEPEIALITNIGPVHLEGFGSIDGVAKAKTEIFQTLAANKTAILNADDDYYPYLKARANSHKHISFALNSTAEITAHDLEYSLEGYAQFALQTLQGETVINLPLLGEHNVMNALAAAAVAVSLGFSLAAIQQGLNNVSPAKNRLQLCTGANDITILNDSYNANPRAFSAALEVLARQPGEKIVVLGDMGELGEQGEQMHREAGISAKAHGVSQLFTIGQLSNFAAASFGESAKHFDDKANLITALKSIPPGSSILIKGSNSAKMWEVTEALI